MRIDAKQWIWIPMILAAAPGCEPLDCELGECGFRSEEEAGEKTFDDEGEKPSSVLPSVCPDPERELPPIDELCSARRQIAPINPLTSACDPAADWTVVQPPNLPGFCRYTPTNRKAEVTAELLSFLPPQAAPDCRVTPQTPLDAPLVPNYHQRFIEATHSVPDPTVHLLTNGKVRVAVVDTAPRRTNDGQSEHGPTVAAIVAELADGCIADPDDGAGCARRVDTVLGLPQLIDGTSDTTLGGYFGYQSDLAEGIYAALDDWNETTEKLIINLSVGWEPQTDQIDGDERPSVTAVRQAITEARCRGALVIAASGNQPVGSCANRAMGPAHWAREDAPSCPALESPAADRPLVYAVTPLDWGRSNLFDFRPGSNAALAAAGFAGTGDLGAGLRRPLTGSSVATATVSGIAALVWSAYPALQGDQLMTLLYRSGHPRVEAGAPIANDLAAGRNHAPSTQRMITACAALTEACCTLDEQPWRCESLANACGYDLSPYVSAAQMCAATNQLLEAPTVDVANWSAAYGTWRSGLGNGAQTSGTAAERQSTSCLSCGAPMTVELPLKPLAATDMPDAWAIPQPPQHPCPMCVLDPDDDDLELVLDPSYAGMDVVNVTVTIEAANGARAQIHYGGLPLDTVRLYTLHDPALAVGGPGVPPVNGWVAVTFEDPSTDRRFAADGQLTLR